MYTQCPECLSIYEITKDQLRQSKGRVECGVCGERFRAQVRLAESLKSPIFERPNKDKPNTSRSNAPASQAAKRQATPAAPKPKANPTTRSQAKASTQPQLPTQPSAKRKVASPPKAKPSPSAAKTSPKPARTDEHGADDLSDWALATLDANAGMEPLISPRERAQQAAAEKATKSQVPGVLDKTQSKRWAWVMPTLVSLAGIALLAQLTWLMRVPLSGVPVVGRLVLPWCGEACRANATGTFAGSWQIADRRIQPHPSVDGVILVEVTIRNAANEATPYPALRLRLYGEDQRLVAERTLLPDAYMQELRPGDRLSAGALLPLSVALEAPRLDWTSYEIELLPSIVL
jgi:predicted Zn finger-like uncharacterized protein